MIATNELPMRDVVGKRTVEWYDSGRLNSAVIERLSCGHELRESKPGASRRRCRKCGVRRTIEAVEARR